MSFASRTLIERGDDGCTTCFAGDQPWLMPASYDTSDTQVSRAAKKTHPGWGIQILHRCLGAAVSASSSAPATSKALSASRYEHACAHVHRHVNQKIHRHVSISAGMRQKMCTGRDACRYVHRRHVHRHVYRHERNMCTALCICMSSNTCTDMCTDMRARIDLELLLDDTVCIDICM